MAENKGEHQSNFEWNIYEPSLPEQNFEATFCHGSGSPDVKLWRVALESLDRLAEFWPFMVSLEFLEGFERLCEIMANIIKVSVYLNGKLVAENQVSKFLFCISNRFKYFMDGIAKITPQEEPHYLLIRIEISLRSGDTVNEDFFPKDLSLRMLSSDLESLLRTPKYSDMTLWSTKPRLDFPTHSCILGERWNNFFAQHPFHGDEWKSLETNISAPLLLDLLIFTYSGTWGVNWPCWKEPAYATELFQVMDSYRMSPLRKSFLKNEMRHVRVSKIPVVIQSFAFRLGVVKDRPVANASHTCAVDLKPKCGVVFRLRVGVRAGDWLSYSLQSKSESRLYAEVNFRLEKRVEGKKQDDFVFHEQRFSIDPKSSVEPRCVLFLGCPETFGDFVSDEREAEFFVHCFLKISNGTRVEQVTTVGGDRMRYASELLRALGKDMRRVRKRKLHTDMQILSTPGFFDGIVLAEGIHRAIFEARVPRWWAGLENTPPEKGVNETATSTLGIDTLPNVLDYIYTGESSAISKISCPFAGEVENFACKTLFYALHDLVICIPSGGFYKRGA